MIAHLYYRSINLSNPTYPLWTNLCVLLLLCQAQQHWTLLVFFKPLINPSNEWECPAEEEIADDVEDKQV